MYHRECCDVVPSPNFGYVSFCLFLFKERNSICDKKPGIHIFY